MDTPQFETAKYTTSSQNTCKRCSQSIGDAYYRISGDMTCVPCGEKAKLELPEDSHAAFVRALIFGAGGAVVGLALYATFTIATGLIIGYVSLAVGYIIAKAMKAGSKGFGGRRYQVAAVILTYMAVSLAAIPIGVSQFIKQRDARRQAATQQVATPGDTAAPNEPVQEPHRAPTNVGGVLLSLVFAGLASPFLELQQSPSAFIGLFILFIGMRIAWKMTDDDAARHAIVGPFRSTTAAAPLAST
jgi:uncharacterized protein (DUF983 family)